jgi:glutamyl-tRNA synthetase
MEWLGLEYDEGPIYQTDRLGRYKEVAEQLVAEGKAYYAYESKDELEAMRNEALEKNEKPRYNGAYRDANAPWRDDPNRVIRFKNPPSGVVAWDDRIKGRIEFSNTELDDLVIFRSDGYATYNFAVVVDDLDMGITDVIRGDDHVNNTPRQINIYRALGDFMPRFAHMPMILDPEGAKLSKRHGAANVMQYRDDGYLPHALLNYLVRLGWSHGDQEIFSKAEMFGLFNIENVNSKASRLDPAKLNWINQHYLKTDAPEAVAGHLIWHLQNAGYDLQQGPNPEDVVVALRDRVHTLKEMAEKAKCWYRPLSDADFDAVAQAKQITAAVREPLALFLAKLQALSSWTLLGVHQAFADTLAELNLPMGKLGPAIRIAITGGTASPSIDHTVFLCGRDQALQRLQQALDKLPA